MWLSTLFVHTPKTSISCWLTYNRYKFLASMVSNRHWFYKETASIFKEISHSHDKGYYGVYIFADALEQLYEAVANMRINDHTA